MKVGYRSQNNLRGEVDECILSAALEGLSD